MPKKQRGQKKGKQIPKTARTRQQPSEINIEEQVENSALSLRAQEKTNSYKAYNVTSILGFATNTTISEFLFPKPQTIKEAINVEDDFLSTFFILFLEISIMTIVILLLKKISDTALNQFNHPDKKEKKATTSDLKNNQFKQYNIKNDFQTLLVICLFGLLNPFGTSSLRLFLEQLMAASSLTLTKHWEKNKETQIAPYCLQQIEKIINHANLKNSITLDLVVLLNAIQVLLRYFFDVPQKFR